MDDSEIEYLDSVRKSLIPKITWGTQLTAELISSGCATCQDIKDIEEEHRTTSKRVEALIDLMKHRVNGYKNLRAALDKSRQSGAVAILDKKSVVPGKNSPNTQASSSRIQQQTGMSVPLTVTGDPHSIILKTSPELVALLSTKNVNTSVILQIAALNYFDRNMLDEVLYGPYSTESPRINEFLRLLSTLPAEDLKTCVEKLCNLDGQPVLSRRIGDLFRGRCSDLVK